VINQTLVFQIKFCGENPALQVARKTFYATLGQHKNSNGATKIFKHKSTDKEAGSGLTKV
jgi:hypothetical protein